MNDAPVAVDDAATTAEDTPVSDRGAGQRHRPRTATRLAVSGVSAAGARHRRSIRGRHGHLHAGGELQRRRQLHLHGERRPRRRRRPATVTVDGHGGQRRAGGGERRGDDGRRHAGHASRSWRNDTDLDGDSADGRAASSTPAHGIGCDQRRRHGHLHAGARTTTAPTASPTRCSDGHGGVSDGARSPSTVTRRQRRAGGGRRRGDDGGRHAGHDRGAGQRQRPGRRQRSSVSWRSAPAHGTVVDQPDGTITYTPARELQRPRQLHLHGAATATAASATATVSVTVTRGRTTRRSAVNDSATTAEDTPVTIAVLANDTDVDGDSADGQRA